MSKLIMERKGVAIGIMDRHGIALNVGDAVRVRYWHGFEFVGLVQYHRRYAADAIGDDPILEMDFEKGTTLEVLPAPRQEKG